MCGSWVRILYADQPDLHLTVIPTGVGKNVRLMNKNLITSAMESEWYMDNQPTRLKTFLGYLCGKLHDPGVVTCVDQTEKSSFTFHGTNTGVQIIADNNLCLTKMGSDSGVGGYFLNLKPCNRGGHQMFIIEPVSRDGTDLSVSYGGPLFNIYYKPGNYNYLPNSSLSRSFSKFGFGSFGSTLNNIDVSPPSNGYTSYRRVTSRTYM